MMNAIHRLLQPIRTRLANIVNRAIVNLINDSKAFQLVQVSVYAGEVHENVEHPQEYGHASNCPTEGAVAVVLCPQGSRDQIMAVVVANPALRKKDLKPGESAMYNALSETHLLLKEDGTIEADTDTLTSTGDVEDKLETLDDVRQRLKAFIAHFNTHVHTSAAPGSPTSPPATPAVPPAVPVPLPFIDTTPSI